jgi:hypothetical protein
MAFALRAKERNQVAEARFVANRRRVLIFGMFAGQNVPSAARVAAGAFGFLTLIQVLDGPLYQRLPRVAKPGLIVC